MLERDDVAAPSPNPVEAAMEEKGKVDSQRKDAKTIVGRILLLELIVICMYFSSNLINRVRETLCYLSFGDLLRAHLVCP